MESGSKTIHAEISIIPLGKDTGTSISREVAFAFDAIQKIKDLKAVLTPMGTVIETNSISTIFEAVKAAHAAVKSAGSMRIISTIRIDERFDKASTLDDKVRSVMEKI